MARAACVSAVSAVSALSGAGSRTEHAEVLAAGKREGGQAVEDRPAALQRQQPRRRGGGADSAAADDGNNTVRVVACRGLMEGVRRLGGGRREQRQWLGMTAVVVLHEERLAQGAASG